MAPERACECPLRSSMDFFRKEMFERLSLELNEVWKYRHRSVSRNEAAERNLRRRRRRWRCQTVRRRMGPRDKGESMCSRKSRASTGSAGSGCAIRRALHSIGRNDPAGGADAKNGDVTGTDNRSLIFQIGIDAPSKAHSLRRLDPVRRKCSMLAHKSYSCKFVWFGARPHGCQKRRGGIILRNSSLGQPRWFRWLRIPTRRSTLDRSSDNDDRRLPAS